MQKLLEEFDLAGHIVTCRRDPLPKKTFEAAAAADTHLIVQLKDNQPDPLSRKPRPLAPPPSPCRASRPWTRKARNRHETRTDYRVRRNARRQGTEWEPHVRRRHSGRARGQPLPTRDRPLEALAGNLVLSVQPPRRRQNRRRRHSQALGDREQVPLHARRHASSKTPRASERTPASSPECESLAYNILRCNQSDTIPQDRFAVALGGVKSILSS